MSLFGRRKTISLRIGTKTMAKTKTRSKPAVKTAAEAVAATASTAPKVSLSPEDSNPPKLFILPKDASSEARIFTITDTNNPLKESKYLCCPEKGFFEFMKITPPSSMKSWLIVPSTTVVEPSEKQNSSAVAKDSEQEFTPSKGYTCSAREMLLATPIDPLFLILSALSPAPTSSMKATKHLFLASYDYLDTLTTNSPQLRSILQAESTRKRLEARMATICETVEAGDEIMYRFDESRLLSELFQKAQNVVDIGLPLSMEHNLIRKALEVPILGLKRGESSMNESLDEEESTDTQGAATPTTDRMDSQNSVSTAPTSVSETDEPADGNKSTTVPTPKPPIVAPEGIPQLLRLRVALNFITASYLPPHLQHKLSKLLHTPGSSPIDFSSLDAHLAHLSELRKEAQASRSMGDYSRKRTLNEDDEVETRAEKKRKKDEEEKMRRANESRGVRELKKVNVSGMKKMSDFFKKK